MSEMDHQNILALKRKCNAQLDEILKLQKKLEELRLDGEIKQRKIDKLMEEKSHELNRCKDPMVRVDSDQEDYTEDAFMECARALRTILKEVPRRNIFIKYQYKSQNSQDFYRVSKPEFDEILGDLVHKNNFNNFFAFCGSLGVIRMDKQGKYTFGNTKFYMFSRKAFDYARNIGL